MINRRIEGDLFTPEQKERFVAHRMIVKIGSSTITGGESLDLNFMGDIARQVSELRRGGVEVMIVSSGAVACGKSSIPNFNEKDILDMRKAAAVGQPKLMAAWASVLGEDIKIGQVIVTENDLPRAKDVLIGLLKDGIVPVGNANDSVNEYEMKQVSVSADNDRLTGFVAREIAADTVVFLTDRDGVLDERGELIDLIDTEEELAAVIKEEGDGVGGMLSKGKVGLDIALDGRTAIVANGREPDVLLKAARGKKIGTRFGHRWMLY